MNNLLNGVIWTYIAITFISFVFMVSLIRKTVGVSKYIYIVLSISALWAVVNNIFWLFNENTFPITDKIPLFSEYFDYIVTTSLNLTALAFFAMNKKEIDKSLVFLIVTTDITMFVTGALAEYSTSFMRHIWFWIGVIPFLIIMFFIWKTLRIKAKGQTKTIYQSFLQLSAYITFFWSLYPIFWYLGPFEFSLITITQVEIAYHFFNIFTKAGYYFYMYSKLKKVETNALTDLKEV